jgi:hypothetical protein
LSGPGRAAPGWPLRLIEIGVRRLLTRLTHFQRCAQCRGTRRLPLWRLDHIKDHLSDARKQCRQEPHGVGISARRSEPSRLDHHRQVIANALVNEVADDGQAKRVKKPLKLCPTSNISAESRQVFNDRGSPSRALPQRKTHGGNLSAMKPSGRPRIRANAGRLATSADLLPHGVRRSPPVRAAKTDFRQSGVFADSTTTVNKK